MLVLAYVAAFSFSWGPIPWVIPSELVHSHLRAKVVALGTVLNWVADWAVVGSFLSLNRTVGEAGSFAVYAIINAAAWLFVWLLVPETKGRQLEDLARSTDVAEVQPMMLEPRAMGEAEVSRAADTGAKTMHVSTRSLQVQQE